MAGFGSISLAQTVIGTLLDQRAIVLYKQPDEIAENDWVQEYIISELWGNTFKYEELFSGLLSGNGDLTSLANVVGVNPYGITYIDAKVNVESDLCDHPLEKGSLVTDASILLPVSADITVAMPTFFAERIYKQIEKMYKNKEPKIILQTKYSLYKNMVLKDFDYDLDAATIDRTKFKLSLREIQEVKTYGEFNSGNKNVKKASDVSTVDIGTQISIKGA